ncbi:hypothetical protein EVAR_11355_1 [Eumeta japonica]|uniref:Uncharacterized protein n=1 Tax=Eumeta variegata TaxID=151549 RepID=A0A4C1U0U3_EUMVA|nr:hypothetical protein EVAR_11355_1 [Eumeta japonica]
MRSRRVATPCAELEFSPALGYTTYYFKRVYVVTYSQMTLDILIDVKAADVLRSTFSCNWKRERTRNQIIGSEWTAGLQLETRAKPGPDYRTGMDSRAAIGNESETGTRQ